MKSLSSRSPITMSLYANHSHLQYCYRNVLMQQDTDTFLPSPQRFPRHQLLTTIPPPSLHSSKHLTPMPHYLFTPIAPTLRPIIHRKVSTRALITVARMLTSPCPTLATLIHMAWRRIQDPQVIGSTLPKVRMIESAFI